MPLASRKTTVTRTVINTHNERRLRQWNIFFINIYFLSAWTVEKKKSWTSADRNSRRQTFRNSAAAGSRLGHCDNRKVSVTIQLKLLCDRNAYFVVRTIYQRNNALPTQLPPAQAVSDRAARHLAISRTLPGTSISPIWERKLDPTSHGEMSQIILPWTKYQGLRVTIVRNYLFLARLGPVRPPSRRFHPNYFRVVAEISSVSS